MVQISSMASLVTGTGRGRIHVAARLIDIVLVDDRVGPAAEAIVEVMSLRLLKRLGCGMLASEAGVLQSAGSTSIVARVAGVDVGGVLSASNAAIRCSSTT